MTPCKNNKICFIFHSDGYSPAQHPPITKLIWKDCTLNLFSPFTATAQPTITWLKTSAGVILLSKSFWVFVRCCYFVVKKTNVLRLLVCPSSWYRSNLNMGQTNSPDTSVFYHKMTPGKNTKSLQTTTKLYPHYNIHTVVCVLITK